jgi:hypothetical protein
MTFLREQRRLLLFMDASFRRQSRALLEEIVGVSNRVAGDDVENARLECAVEDLGPAVKLIGREGKGEGCVWGGGVGVKVTLLAAQYQYLSSSRQAAR